MSILVNNPKVSIITPIYNASNYISRCVNSILNQTFEDWELLLIDDGSIDDSLDICRTFAEKDDRIKCFHKDNGGVSSARQYGQDKATGIFTIHIDSDDIVDQNMLQELYDCAVNNNVDIVFCDYFEERNGVQTYHHEGISKKNNVEIIRLLLESKICCSCWNKLVRRSFYQNIVCFEKGVNMSEDLLWCIDVLMLSPQIAYIPKAFYHYDRSNENSSTRKFNEKTISSDLLLLKKLYSHFSLNKEFLSLSLVNIGAEIVHRSFVTGLFDNKDFVFHYGAIKNHILKSHFNLWLKVLMYLSLCGGYRMSYKIYNKIVHK